MWFKEKTKAKRIVLAIFLLFVVLIDAILIYEAANPGEASSEKSTAIGTIVADALNNIAESFGDKTPPITDLDSFLAFFRKLVGHYGAFLILAILSTVFFMLGFDGEKWKWSIPVNFAHGLFVALLTEGIQLFTPGRHGALSDVGIDFAGYATSGVIITAVILLAAYHSNKKNNQSI